MSREVERAVGYFRVSTKQQGRSGLGLDGQRTAGTNYVSRNGATLLGEYVEVETGKAKDRPQLLKAIAHAKRSKARLVVAKLDRLARNAAFTSALMESGVDFVACDNRHENLGCHSIPVGPEIARIECETVCRSAKRRR